MKVISVINYKGGVGKTTITANIAAELARRNKRVLLIDVDAQASLTFSFVSPLYWDENLKNDFTIKKYFDAMVQGEPLPSLSDLIIHPKAVNERLKDLGSYGSVGLLSSDLGLINVDEKLAVMLHQLDENNNKLNYVKVYNELRKSIVSAATGYYDIVLIDCPPNFNIVTKSAIVASDQILIPAKPDYLSTLGIDYLQKNLAKLVHEFNDYAAKGLLVKPVSPQILGVVFTMIQLYANKPISSQQQFISQTKRLGMPTFNAMIRDNKTMISSSSQEGIPIALYGLYGSHLEMTKEIQALVDELNFGVTM